MLSIDGDDPAWTPLDVNGDGGQDLARAVIGPLNQLYVQELISLGNGQWQPEPATSIDPSSTLHVNPSDDPIGNALSDADNENWQPTDVNLDGRGDLVKATESAGDVHVQMLLSDGAGGWIAQDSLEPIPAGNSPGNWRVDSDRGAITLTHLTDAGGADALQTMQSDLEPDAIASTANGLGANTAIGYGHGTGYSAADTPGPQCRVPQGSLPYLVTSIATHVNDVGLQPATITVGGKTLTSLHVNPSTIVSDSSSVRYACPRYSPTLQSFQGWTDSWTTHDVAANPVTGGPGRPGSIDHVIRTIDDSGIQQTSLNATTSLDGVPLEQTKTSYEPVGDGPPYVDLPSRSESGHCDAGGCATSTRTLSYDANGDVIDEFDAASGSGLQRETKTSYDDNDQLWMHRLPHRTDVYAPQQGNKLLRASLHCYDGDTSPLCDHPSATTARGLITAVRKLADQSSQEWVTTHAYGYDQYGNQTSSTDGDGHTSTTTYDSQGLFPIRFCNALRPTPSAAPPAATTARPRHPRRQSQ